MHQSRELLDKVGVSSRVLLTGPENPDGDSIGACLALQRALQAKFPGITVDVAGRPGFRYGGLPGAADMVDEATIETNYDGVVILDGDHKRLHPNINAAFYAAQWRGIIDHHRSTDTSVYGVVIFAPTAESTCGMVARLLEEWGVKLDKALAEVLYTGLVFDTGAFRYSNTKRETHFLAAELVELGIDHAAITRKVLLERRFQSVVLMGRVLGAAEPLAGGKAVMGVCTRAMMSEVGAIDEDIEGIIDGLQVVDVAELAVLVVEKGDARVKLSLRSQGGVDVAAFAKSLDADGGGHARAAGVTLKMPLERALGLVRERVGVLGL